MKSREAALAAEWEGPKREEINARLRRQRAAVEGFAIGTR